MELRPEDLKKFRLILVRAFPSDTGELALVVDDADIGLNFNDYTARSYEINVQTLLKAAAGREQLTKLF